MSALAAIARPAPGSPEWLRLVTASKVPAILGLSPYESPRSMWHIMRGDIPAPDENEAMRRGTMLENAVLDWWLTDNPDRSDDGRQVWRPLGTWAGATPDMLSDGELVDAKTAAADRHWGQPGTDQVPAHYAASSMWQLAVFSECPRVRIAVLFGQPFALREYVIERDDDLCGLMVDQCADFYASLHDPAAAPPLDDSLATLEALRALHPEIDREASVELALNERDEYLNAAAALAAAEARDRLARSTVLHAMGHARRAFHDGQVIARRQPHPSGAVALVRVAPLPEGDEQ